MAGIAADLAAADGDKGLDKLAREQFKRAKEAPTGIPWLISLARGSAEPPTPAERKQGLVMQQVERLETYIHKLGTVHDRSFAERERDIREGLKSGTGFEAAQVLLGEHLGFEAGKKEEDASPDPWWRVGDIVLVFEDHANAGANAIIDATKARQAASHSDWVRAHVPGTAEAKIQPVLVTPATTAKKGAVPHLGRVGLWSLEEFQNWTDAALDAVREIRRKFVEPGDLDWRANAAALLEKAGADAPSLYERLSARPAGQHLKEVA